MKQRVVLKADLALCSGLRVCFCQSLAARRPDLMRQWDFKANIGLDPTALGCTSERRATWKCPKHGPWVTQIQVSTAPTDLPYLFLRSCIPIALFNGLCRVTIGLGGIVFFASAS